MRRCVRARRISLTSIELTDGEPSRARWPLLFCPLTPPGEGGISILEISGTGALETLDPLFINPRGRHASSIMPGEILYGKLWRQGILLDEAILEGISREPCDSAALNAHGGAAALQRLTAALREEGMRPCEWPEMVRRREAMGLLDAISAVAAERIPDAPTFLVARVLLDQYNGALRRELDAIRDEIEKGLLAAARERVDRLLTAAQFALRLLRPPRLVIAGRPNVGKSTLGNALLRHDRLIVHATPGTTRDMIEDNLAIRDLPFVLADTAGIRAATDAIESDGVRRSRNALAEADLILLLFDSSEALQDEDIAAIEAARGRPALYVLNKSDLPRRLDVERLRLSSSPILISAKTEEGLAELEEQVVRALYPDIPPAGAPVPFTEEQESALRMAREALERGDSAGAPRFLQGKRT